MEVPLHALSCGTLTAAAAAAEGINDSRENKASQPASRPGPGGVGGKGRVMTLLRYQAVP